MKKVQPEEGKSADIVSENIERLKELFPDAFSEGAQGDKKIDFDVLRQLLGDARVLDEGEEKYGLNWHGKKKARQIALTPSTGTLLPCPEESVDWDTTQNLFIEGDNLEVLKLLQKSYANKVKMIYIDPPYNTGKEFIYPDRFQENLDTYLKYTGQIDDEGMKLSTNSEGSGRYHTNWLNMMYPRLFLAKQLLSKDGVIYISIDDGEQARLKQVCDEIFGEENYLNTISLNTKVGAGASGGGEDKRLKKNIEYVLVYAKNFNELIPVNPVYKETKLTEYIQKMKLDNKSFKYTNILYKTQEVEKYKTIKTGDGDNLSIYKVNDFEIRTVNQVAKDEKISQADVYKKYYDKIMTTTNAQTSIRDRVWEATDSENTMYLAKYIPKSGKNKGRKTTLVFIGKQKVLVIWLKDTTVMIGDEIYKREKKGTFWDGFSWINVTKEGNVKFENGKKPIALIQQMLDLYSNGQDGEIVLDFFAGSGSTAHAVLDSNIKNNRHRRFICVQLPEKLDPKKKESKDSYAFCKKNDIEENVASLAKERIKRSSANLDDVVGFDMGFKSFKLASSNINKWNPDHIDLEKSLLSHQEHLINGRSEKDVLYELLLKRGVDLAVPIESREVRPQNTQENNHKATKDLSVFSVSSVFTIYSVGYGVLFACLSESINKDQVEQIGQGIVEWHRELAPSSDTHVFFRDSAFRDDVSKTNMVAILEQNGINHVRSL